MEYPYLCGSPSNPNGEEGWLGYPSLEKAEEHRITMNKLIEIYDENPKNFWDKNFWKTMPQEWVIKENPKFRS